MPDEHELDALIESIVMGPELPNAACIDRGELFDPPEPDEGHHDVEYRRRAARQICSTCPTFAACEANITTFEQLRGSRGFLLAGRVIIGVSQTGARPRSRDLPAHTDTDRDPAQAATQRARTIPTTRLA